MKRLSGKYNGVTILVLDAIFRNSSIDRRMDVLGLDVFRLDMNNSSNTTFAIFLYIQLKTFLIIALCTGTAYRSLELSFVMF